MRVQWRGERSGMSEAQADEKRGEERLETLRPHMLGSNDAVKIISRLLDKKEPIQTEEKRRGGFDEGIEEKIVISGRRPTGEGQGVKERKPMRYIKGEKMKKGK